MNLHPDDGCELCIRTLEARRVAMQQSQEPEPDDEDEADRDDYTNGWPPKA